MQERPQQRPTDGRDRSTTQLIDVIDLTTGESVVVATSPSQVNNTKEQLDQVIAGLTSYRDSIRRNLSEREAALTCPISYDLFESPVVTECCGKTFSLEALTQVLRWKPQCPICSTPHVRTHTSRDIANLVELYRSERSLLDEAEAAVQRSIELAEQVQRNHQERRKRRVQARTAVVCLQASLSGGEETPIELED